MCNFKPSPPGIIDQERRFFMVETTATQSNLLSAFLDDYDMRREEGEFVVHGSFAYAHQYPW